MQISATQMGSITVSGVSAAAASQSPQLPENAAPGGVGSPPPLTPPSTPTKGTPTLWRAGSRPPQGFQVVSRGEVGDKARVLMQRADALRRCGFQVPETVVLAQGALDPFFATNQMGRRFTDPEVSDETVKKILAGILPKKLETALKGILEKFGETAPLIVRSSALGDARGNGVYESILCAPNFEDLKQALLRVIASYFTPNALAFRRKANTGEGFGIMIMPVVGQKLTESDLFGPLLSGYGYSSTPAGEGYVNIVPGLGGGVSSRHGLKVRKSDLETSGGVLVKYLDKIANARLDQLECNLRPSNQIALLGDTDLEHHFQTNKPFCTVWDAHHQTDQIAVLAPDLVQRYVTLNLIPLFEMLSALEREFDRPQYIEWAMTLDDSGPKFYVLQNADVDVHLDWVDFGNVAPPFLSGIGLIGSTPPEGLICQNLVICMNHQDREALAQFNRDHSGHVVFYPSAFLMNKYGQGYTIGLADIENAAVVVEYPDGHNHSGSIEAHWSGQLDQTGKILGVMEEPTDLRALIETHGPKTGEAPRLVVIEGRFLVKASANQQRFEIRKLEDPE